MGSGEGTDMSSGTVSESGPTPLVTTRVRQLWVFGTVAAGCIGILLVVGVAIYQPGMRQFPQAPRRGRILPVLSIAGLAIVTPVFFICGSLPPTRLFSPRRCESTPRHDPIARVYFRRAVYRTICFAIAALYLTVAFWMEGVLAGARSGMVWVAGLAGAFLLFLLAALPTRRSAERWIIIHSPEFC